ncbi:MAG TPA: hypothetical protein VJ755_03245 [Gemmatimonadales bacterium]|nr:hypothetical protein [Gemmatimonadales bacterium]
MAGRKRGFRLSARMRRELRTDINLEALEQLVGLVPTESRDLVLRAFLARPTATTGRVDASLGYDLSFRDPKLQRLLDQVITPTPRSALAAWERTRQFDATQRPLLEDPIRVVILNAFGEPMIARRTRTQPHDVILMPETHLNAGWLDRAITRLLTERRVNGLRPERDYSFAISAGQLTRRLPAAWDRYLVQMLERLRASTPALLGDLGSVRFIELRLM